MGSRIGRVLLVAAAVLILLGGAAAAALLASSGDGDESVQLGAEGPSAPADDPAGSPTTETEAPNTETESPEPPEPDDSPADAGSGQGERKTTFPRERKGSAQDDQPQRVFTIPPAREFSGTGNARLGTVNLREPAIVKWTTSGSFELRFGREAFPIIAPSPSGQLVVPPYDFEFVRVVAKGRWKISITPQR
jgi:hypothetical protein